MAQKPTASASVEKEEAVPSASVPAPESAPESIEKTPKDREEAASKLVNRFAIWSGVAGLIPVPVVDALAVGGFQLQMVRRISQIFDVPFSENRGKALVATLVGAMVPATSTLGAVSMLKIVPVVGTLTSSFVMPVLSAGATYAIGKAFIQHFASGGTLLDFNPPDYREFIKAQKEMWESKSTRSSAGSGSGRPADKTAEAVTTSS